MFKVRKPGRSPAGDTGSEAAARADVGGDTGGADTDGDASPRPYLGGRAQAESGARIIQNDLDAWRVTAGGPDATLPADHPRAVQFAQAWRAVVKHGLGDDPGAAAIRYRVLAHAAGALAAVPTMGDPEAGALTRLADHAEKHAERLRFTAEHLFLASGKAGAYGGGRAQAAGGSRIVERDYRAWAGSPAATLAASDGELWKPVKVLRGAWDEVVRRGLRDGPGPAAARYRTLADAAVAVADGFTANLPSAGLAGLLELAGHARKHAVRLQATAGGAARVADYQDLPEQVAAVASQARTNRRQPAGRTTGQAGSNGSRQRDERGRPAVSGGQAAPERGR